MGFGHIFVDAEPTRVLAALDGHLGSKGYSKIEMTSDRHPAKMKIVDENRLRLFWVSPRLGKWTGVFEFRYYGNEDRQRWGYTDEDLAIALSTELSAAVYRMEVADGAGFWLYAKYEKGRETAGKAYQDSILEETADRSHPRYELNRIIEQEGIRNIGLGYENIPGFEVCAIENIPQRSDGIEGLEGFVHRAFERGVSKAPETATAR